MAHLPFLQVYKVTFKDVTDISYYRVDSLLCSMYQTIALIRDFNIALQWGRCYASLLLIFSIIKISFKGTTLFLSLFAKIANLSLNRILNRLNVYFVEVVSSFFMIKEYGKNDLATYILDDDKFEKRIWQ